MKKRLIVCCDGTWSKPGARNTNVVKMWRAILPADGEGTVQKSFYDEGVGTEGGRLRRMLGGAVGLGLNRNIQEAYRFLVHLYEPGDDLFLFGFSRGAYTVRSLAGLLRNSGLLKPEHEDKVQEAFRLYRDPFVKPASPEAERFREANSHEVDILCLGVWDTVGSLGIPRWLLGRFMNREEQFHDVELSSRVRNGYQALAIDERRRPFTPAIWQIQKRLGEAKAREAKEGQEVEQVWFAGCHSDVGGGNEGMGLSDFAFDWMVRKASALGLAFDDSFLGSNVHPDAMGRIHESATSLWWVSALLNRRKLGRTWWQTEAAHSAVIRRQDDPTVVYDAKNLAEYRTSEHFRVAEESSSGESEVPEELRIHG